MMQSSPNTPQQVQRVNGSVKDKEWTVKRTIPAETVDAQGRTKSERERELERTVRELQQQVRQLQGQVSRMQRFDGNRAKMTDHQMMQAVIQSNLAVAERLREMFGKQQQQGTGDPLIDMALEAQSDHRAEQRERTAEIAQNIAAIDRLMRAKQETTEVCPCGQHQGLRFIEGEIVLEENLCPKDWWFRMSNHAFYHNCLGQFQKDNPFKEYLKQYRL